MRQEAVDSADIPATRLFLKRILGKNILLQNGDSGICRIKRISVTRSPLSRSGSFIHHLLISLVCLSSRAGHGGSVVSLRYPLNMLKGLWISRVFPSFPDLCIPLLPILPAYGQTISRHHSPWGVCHPGTPAPERDRTVDRAAHRSERFDIVY